ncbi:MAG TPA: histidine kinase [Panacibacter sp.]|mgnify:CR=1 FL=1|nr:histidine kinase [Panacibacter sp.]HNP44155.1 histidine kinase [Panacibacter sp.]
MILVRPRKIEWASYFILMPLIDAGTCFMLLGSHWYLSVRLWIFGFFYTMITGLLVWYIDVICTRYINSALFGFRETGKRLFILTVKQFFIVLLSVNLIMSGFKLMDLPGYDPSTENFWISLGLAYFVTFIAMIIWEANYIFTEWKRSLAEKEKYEHLSLQSEFDTLKSQVNPHFLFNCFNTLSSLISEDKQQAEKFLDELSKVYRYLLRNNEDGMTTLKSELQFILSYFELLKTRHCDAIQLELEIDKKYENYLLPSLSLQMLVENAVKHNALSKHNPLVIEIFSTAGNKLVVNNNLVPRTQKAPSGKIGLKNIRAKYELLKQPGFQVMEEPKSFTVVLPLIWDNGSKRKTSLLTNKGL